MRASRFRSVWCGVLAAVLWMPRLAEAQASYGGVVASLQGLGASIMQASDGKLYGTTNSGTVFTVDPASGIMTTLSSTEDGGRISTGLV
jgi:hypothetical protein